MLVIFWDTLSSAVIKDSVVQHTEYAGPEHSLTVLRTAQLYPDPYLSITNQKSILDTIYTT